MNDLNKTRGRVTIPTDVDVVPETLDLLERWGADAIRDCDGTDYPEALKSVDAKVYSTYYTTRKDNAWAKANPNEVQQCYIMTGFYPALEDNPSLLKAALEHALPVISSYLTRIFPCTAPHLRYEDALYSVMENVKKERLREQMLFLLRKTSDGTRLDTAAQKSREAYTDVNNKRWKKILDKFEALNVTPITLLNAGKLKSLPHLGAIVDVKCALQVAF